jgi:hypothetical protein
MKLFSMGMGLYTVRKKATNILELSLMDKNQAMGFKPL